MHQNGLIFLNSSLIIKENVLYKIFGKYNIKIRRVAIHYIHVQRLQPLLNIMLFLCSSIFMHG